MMPKNYAAMWKAERERADRMQEALVDWMAAWIRRTSISPEVLWENWQCTDEEEQRPWREKARAELAAHQQGRP